MKLKAKIRNEEDLKEMMLLLRQRRN